MLVYWLLFLTIGAMAATRVHGSAMGALPSRALPLWYGFFVMLILIVGLRQEVGGDWPQYLEHLNGAAGEPMIEAILQTDPAYGFLNWLGANGWGGVYFVNTVCTLLFTWGLLVFCQAQPRPWLALLVAVPYLIIVVGMGYTRQAVAIGLAMAGLVSLTNARLTWFICWIIVGTLFHKSAVILIPIALFSSRRQRAITFVAVVFTAAILFILLVYEALDALVAGYVEAEYESSGAGVRVAMNALPAIVFLLWRQRFALPPTERRFWTAMSLGALLFVPLLLMSPSSTAVDRLALYWIPVQLFVWSRLPDALGLRYLGPAIWVYGVVLYSALVLFVWLFFSAHSSAWLPYRFHLWEALVHSVQAPFAPFLNCV